MKYTAPKINITGFDENIMTGPSGPVSHDSNPAELQSRMNGKGILADTMANIADMAI